MTEHAKEAKKSLHDPETCKGNSDEGMFQPKHQHVLDCRSLINDVKRYYSIHTTGAIGILAAIMVELSHDEKFLNASDTGRGPAGPVVEKDTNP